MAKSLGERFWEKVNCAGPTQPHMSTCCWEWTGCQSKERYGKFYPGSAYGRMGVGAHRMSLSFVLGYIPAYVMHRCDNPACVRPSHLKEGTHSQNMQDAWDKRRQPERGYKGSKNPFSRLTEDDVRAIRKRYESGETQTAIGEAFGIKQSTVSDIVRRTRWTHVK